METISNEENKNMSTCSGSKSLTVYEGLVFLFILLVLFVALMIYSNKGY